METNGEPTVFSGPCPARELLGRIADKWTALIMAILAQVARPMRFGELRRAVPGISQKMLTQTLREMERDGLVSRTLYPQIPPRVEYALTPLGVTLREPMEVLTNWVESHMPEVRASQQAFDRKQKREKAS
jgi:DNA-binding HxlR family transcriptional regulator